MHLSDKAAQEVNDLREENQKLKTQLSESGHEMSHNLGTSSDTAVEDEIMVLLRPAPGATTTEDEIVMFLKSSSKNGFDYYRGAAASGNDHGEFWFEDLIPGHSQSNESQSCDIACLSYDPVCGENGMTFACGVPEAQCNGVEIAYEGECRDGIEQKNSCEISCLVYDPVCGENGVTYACGETEAECNGVDVSYEGECTVPLDIACTREYAPVCGVDGKTYGNSVSQLHMR